jgi:hypothetical protein
MSDSYRFRIGDIVMWCGSWGSDSPKETVVVSRGVKDDAPVYDLANGHWAYEEQLSLREAKIIQFPTKR